MKYLGFKDLHFSAEWWFLCYLYHGVPSRWSGFPGNPAHPSRHVVGMTERLLHFDPVIMICFCNVGFLQYEKVWMECLVNNKTEGLGLSRGNWFILSVLLRTYPYALATFRLDDWLTRSNETVILIPYFLLMAPTTLINTNGVRNQISVLTSAVLSEGFRGLPQSLQVNIRGGRPNWGYVTTSFYILSRSLVNLSFEGIVI